MASRTSSRSSERQVTQLVDAQGLIQARMAQQAAAAARQRLEAFTDWWDGNAVQSLSADIAQAVASAQKITAQTTDAYLTRAAGTITGKTIRAAGQIDVSRLRKGTTLDRVYNRLARDYRYLVSQKRPVEEALNAVLARSTAMTHMDVALAQRAQGQATLIHQGIKGYRRVLHPELAHVTGTCGLCIVAADQKYRVEQLLPLHNGCHCGILPITDAHDPGQDLNAADLKAIYQAAGSTEAEDLHRVQAKVHLHGELGPVLTNAQYDWRSPKDVAA